FTAELGTVRRICAALDDLPLAIELAAARSRTLGIEDLADRLDDLLGVARGNRTVDERQRTLRSVVAWSWVLLSDSEQRAAQRFTVFVGGATAESAARVCGIDGGILESLVDKSLLDAAGEHDSVRRAHAQHLLELVRTADPPLRRAEQPEWLPVVAAEHGDLPAALRRAVREPDVRTAFELLAAAFNYLWIRGASASVVPVAIELRRGVRDVRAARRVGVG
ncbi:AfsR/SARP family transcriptional regulator, partial [Streptomyces sp. NPDC054945]